MTAIQKILIANRGEIAVRVMRTAKEMGIATVAVYSEADAEAPHAQFADEAVCIGPAPVGQSYLNIDAIMDAAMSTGADAIHPGYGFLSENAAFAATVEAAGLIFIGPTSEAIEVMGNKAESKRRMIVVGVPCVPGYEGLDQSDEVLREEGERIGFPLMVKAAAGGGGRGMRLVTQMSDLDAAISTARSEAQNAFGSGELILEKAIIQPRHVEVQVFADTHGTCVHLGERDCSVQRRHQKVIEEAPCPVMSEALRAQMGQAAVDAAQSIQYRGAGTVEFLLDASGAFYFLEMNTRLQVEHPVTEEITGLDLVALQIRVAEGAPLGFDQSSVSLTGHAIEVRLYAEDPYHGFLPRTGQILKWQPATGEGLRFDAGIQSGQEVSPFYDPMLAKVIASGPSREVARRRLIAGLRDTQLFGLAHNRDFLIDCLQQDQFIDGSATTAFIGEVYGDAGPSREAPDQSDLVILALIHYLAAETRHAHSALSLAPALNRFTTMPELRTVLKLRQADEVFEAEIVSSREGAHDAFDISLAGLSHRVHIRSSEPDFLDVLVDDIRYQARFHVAGSTAHASIEGCIHVCENITGLSEGAGEDAASGTVTAPLHGRVVSVFVNEKDAVSAGDRLAIVEAMKMQHEIAAEVDGVVAQIRIAPDQQVAAGDVMIEIEQEV